MLAKLPEDRPSLDVIETVLRDMVDVLDQPVQFAEGSRANITLPATDDDALPWYRRWLRRSTS
jgi:hypothetical protein